MRICYFGTYDRDYCRNEILQHGVRLAGGEVVECHSPVWRTKDKSQVGGFAAKVGTGLRYLAARRSLRASYKQTPGHDAVVIGYMGHFEVGLAKRLARGRPVVLDAFLSLYETAVEDRGLLKPGSPAARILWRMERAAYQRADLILLDTDAHIDYVAEEFGIPHEKFMRVLVGADDRVFRPVPVPKQRRDFREVLFYGKFIPLHGVEYILQAADILRREPGVMFTLVGTGQTHDDARKLAADLKLDNVRWVDWVDYEDLPAWIAAAHVCLGVFAPEGKATRVIPNKVFQALACGARVITADTPAVRELGDVGDALELVPPGDARALAEAVRAACRGEKPTRRSEALQTFAPHALGATLLEGIERLLS